MSHNDRSPRSGYTIQRSPRGDRSPRSEYQIQKSPRGDRSPRSVYPIRKSPRRDRSPRSEYLVQTSSRSDRAPGSSTDTGSSQQIPKKSSSTSKTFDRNVAASSKVIDLTDEEIRTGRLQVHEILSASDIFTFVTLIVEQHIICFYYTYICVISICFRNQAVYTHG